MTEVEDVYDKLRVLLSHRHFTPLPKNELVDKLLKNIYSEEEAFIVANGFKRSFWPVTLRRIRKRTKMKRKELKKKIKEMRDKGKLVKRGHFVLLPGYFPGLFEEYFTFSKDDPERLKKAGEAHFSLIQSGFHVEHHAAGFPVFRVVPAVDPIQKTIEIDKSIKVKNRVLSYEELKKLMKRYKTLAVQPCSCRITGKLSGNPCKLTDENFCVSAGPLARFLIKEEVARRVSYDELMEIFKRAEKEGLVHHTLNMKKGAFFVCNCCPCCCGYLTQLTFFGNRNAIAISNFIPRIDIEKCKVCSLCAKKCPLGAIIKSSDDKMEIDLDLCIGCGICASNCPNGAITLKKVKNYKPVKGHIGVLRKIRRASKKVSKVEV